MTTSRMIQATLTRRRVARVALETVLVVALLLRRLPSSLVSRRLWPPLARMLDAMETAEDPMKDLVVIDADGHVEEHDLTFSDKYLDPAFRAQRPQVVATDGLAYWMIEEQLFPRRLGRGCHNLGTPTSYGGKRTLFTQSKPESLESLELRGPDARLRDMDAEDLGVAVRSAPPFLAGPPAGNAPLPTPPCSPYNPRLAGAVGESGGPRGGAGVQPRPDS